MQERVGKQSNFPNIFNSMTFKVIKKKQLLAMFSGHFDFIKWFCVS